MKGIILLLWLLGLGLCHSQAKASATDEDWVADVANRLYERQILSKAGREALLQQLREGRLGGWYALPGTARYGQLPAAAPAAVLQFCAQAFQAAQLRRSVLLTARQEQQLQKALRKTPVDTAALQRRFAHSGASGEHAIVAEDPPVLSANGGGWTIYPPLGLPAKPQEDWIAAPRSVFGKTRTRTARDLYELGLLSPPDYAQVQRALATQQLTTEADVCQLAAQLAQARATYPTRRVAFDSLLLRLRQANVLTASGQQRALADSLVTRKLSLDALLPYCQQVRVLRGLPHAPQQLYPQLLAEAAALLPALQYTAAQVAFTETPLSQGTTQELTLGFTAGGRHYTNHLRLGWLPPHELAKVSESPYIDAEGLAGLNQWLRDQHAPERLYLATLNLNSEGADLPHAALVLLTPAQLAAWGERGYFDGPEQASAQLTSAHIEEALALYEQLGLLSGRLPAELAEGRRQALSGEAGSHLDLLRSFPGLVLAMGGEDAEEPQAYGNMLAQVATATRGAFRPTSVQDNFPGQRARKQKSFFSFSCGTRRYQASLVSDLGWMDGRFVTLVEQAVRENTDGRLYYLGEGDETSEYLFLTVAQAAALRQAQPELLAEDDRQEAERQKK